MYPPRKTYEQNTRTPFGGRGFASDPAEGAYSAPANTLVGRGGRLSPPQEPHPSLSALRASPLLPHSKISSDAVVDINLLLAYLGLQLQYDVFKFLVLILSF